MMHSDLSYFLCYDFLSLCLSKPQVIWRGTDFGYLPTLSRPKLSAPIKNNIEKFVEDRKLSHEGRQSKMMEATKALREKYDQLLPRWKGAVLSAVSIA